jgi:4a-hydroxytetrahydrobiopterin dehydratase
VKILTTDELLQKKCVPCDNGTQACSTTHLEEQLKQLPGWYATKNNQRIRKDWKVKNFLAGLEFFQAVAVVAEADAHHPDLHLEDYKNLSIEVWTHTIGGLSENDFVLAAKIDQLPITTE